ncbi:MAG: AAA family ATPase [Victivallales bacterium]|nr:AAA family ATPase [Victivallales bacterium]
MDTSIKTIPYGVSDFVNMRELNGYYVDNTWGIPLLEALPYQLFLRPRRFGKSLLLSILHYYYDINYVDRFDELFGGTWIHETPTQARGRYLVLHLDFSKVGGETIEEMQQNFEKTCKIAINAFRGAYKELIPADVQEEMAKQTTFQAELDTLTSNLEFSSKRRIYILIDEYDNFSNRLLAQAGSVAYRELCHGTGFFKTFFALLKAQNKVIQRILLTGVSPMTLDDVTSGFNIAENVSQDPQLATLCGFTHPQIREVLDYYAKVGKFTPNCDQAFQLITDWYDHYRFSEDDDKQVCNPVLLLGFLRNCMATKHFPRDMVDENLRTDYRKLRHIVTTNGRLNGKFNALEQLVTNGSVTMKLIRSFQEETLTRPESFLSLLFYYGMVTIGEENKGKLQMKIPNQLMWQFIADFLLDGYKDACNVDIRINELADKLGDLAYSGDWRPAVELAAGVLKQTLSVRDLLDGEKAVQSALAALLSTGNAFAVQTEHRAGFGFADLSLAPRIITFPDIQYAALIEVKYLRKTEKLSDNTKTTLLAEARKQLERYAEDHGLEETWHLKPKGTVTLIRLAVVFHGEELLFAEEI